MPSMTERLALLITCNGAQAVSEFNRVGTAAGTSLRTAEESTQRLSRGLVVAGAGMVAFGAVALAGLYRAAQAAQEEELAVARLNNTMANSPALAGASTGAFLDQASALQDVTVFADEATIGVQALLGQFGLTQDQILQLTPLVLDLSSKMGISLQAAARAVGRATQGTAGGLSRMIGQFDVGSTSAEAFAGTMEALRSQVGGFAEAEGATFNGQLQIMQNNLGELAEGLGRGALDAFNTMLDPIMGLSEAFSNLSPGVQESIGQVGAFGAAGLIAAGSASMLLGGVINLVDRFKALGSVLGGIGGGPAFLAFAGALAVVGGYFSRVASEAAHAQEATDAFSAALEGQSAGNTGAMEDLVAEIMTANEELSRFAELGVDPIDLAGALSGDTEALAAVNAELDRYIENLEAQQAAGEGDFVGDPGGMQAAIAGVQRFRDELNLQAGALDEATSNQQAAAAASDAFAASQDGAAESAEDFATRMQELNDAISEYLDVQASASELAASGAEAQAQLFESLTASSGNFNANTEAGRANIENMNSWVGTVGAAVQAATDFAERTNHTAVAQDRANTAISDGVASLQRMRDAGLITQQQFESYRQTLLGIPHSINTELNADASNAESVVQRMVGETRAQWERRMTALLDANPSQAQQILRAIQATARSSWQGRHFKAQLDADNAQALTAIQEARRQAEAFAAASYTAHIRIMQTTGSGTPGLSHGTGSAHGGFVRDGESTMVHDGEIVTHERGRTVVTPRANVQGGDGAGIDYRAMGKAIAQELIYAGVVG